jgi:hypothetical protein
MMRRLLLVLGLLILALMPPTVASAEATAWEAPRPKGVEGGLRCTGSVTAHGHTHRDVNYVAPHFDTSGSETPEAARANCDRFARQDVVRFFKFYHGIDLDPALVRVTMEPLP